MAATTLSKSINALQAAIRLVGGQSELARRLKVKRQAVGKWKICPPARALAIEHATGGAVTRYDLRPDIYGAP